MVPKEEIVAEGVVDEDIKGNPKEVMAREAIQRMKDTLGSLGGDEELDRARKYLADTEALFEEKKYFEIPNREDVFKRIINVIKEKHQRTTLLTKIKAVREDIKSLWEKGADVEYVTHIFEDIKEYMREKDYESARTKFIEMDFQIMKLKKSVGEQVKTTSSDVVKRVILADDDDEDDDFVLDMDEDDGDIDDDEDEEEDEWEQEDDDSDGSDEEEDDFVLGGEEEDGSENSPPSEGSDDEIPELTPLD